MHFDRALKAPMKDRIELHVFGGSTTASADILCMQGVNVPAFHCHPNMVVRIGHTTVLVADKERLFVDNRSRTRSQLANTSSSELPHTWISSASSITNPS